MPQVAQAESAPVTAPRFAGTKRYLNPHEAAEYLGVGHSSLNIYRMKGIGPKFIKWGNSVRYDVLELDHFMAERVVTPAAPVTDKRRVGRPRKAATQDSTLDVKQRRVAQAGK